MFMMLSSCHGRRGGYDFRDNDQVDRSASGHYSTHLFTDRATMIINQHNTSQPLFLYLAYQAAHGPLQVGHRPCVQQVFFQG